MGLWNGLRKLKFKILPLAPSAPSAVNPYFLRNTFYFLVTPSNVAAAPDANHDPSSPHVTNRHPSSIQKRASSTLPSEIPGIFPVL